MNDPVLHAQKRRETLSALMDGQATDAEVAQVCAAWRDSEDAQENWATYHLIGEVLRSGDAATGQGSAAFLAGVRSRLAQEPVVLAPAAQRAEPSPRHDAAQADAASRPAPARARRWAGPMAVAAGFVAVLSGVLSLQDARWEPGAASLAAARAPVGTAPALALGASAHAWLPPAVQAPAPQTFAGARQAGQGSAEPVPVGLVVPTAHPSDASFSERGAPVSELVWRVR